MSKLYCKDCQKATIKYKFSDGIQKQAIIRNCPFTIKIENRPLTGWDVYRPRGFYIETTCIQGYNHNSIIRAYRIINGELEYLTCEGKIIRSAHFAAFPGNPGMIFGANTTLEMKNMNEAFGCFNTLSDIHIEVWHQGAIVFKDKGINECTYEVKCENDCKPDELKIDDTAYPGYWCLTKAMQLRLKGIADKVGRINF